MDKHIVQNNVEKSIELEIRHFFSGNLDNQDANLDLLVSALNGQKGIIRAHLKPHRSLTKLCLHYDPGILSLTQVSGMAKRVGSKIQRRYHHARIHIEDLDCSDCSLVIEHSLGRLPGVSSVRADYVTQIMNIEFDRLKTDPAAIKKRIRSLGYKISMNGIQKWYFKNHALIFSLLAGLLLLAGWIGQQWLELPAAISAGLFLVASILAGGKIAQTAWYNLRHYQLDIDLLMLVAAIGAAFLGNYAEGTLLLVLFSLGHALEERALDRARAAVQSLANLAPKTSLLRRAGQEKELPIGQIALEDIVIVRPGTRLPVDGVIVSGSSAIDQSAVTGEPLPVEKNPGEKVFAGTMNGLGALEVRVTRLAKDSTLARVIKLVEEAQLQKSPTQLHTERFERFFVPLVLIADLLLISIPPLFGFPFRQSFLRAMTLLVAASPCALALGTPASILAGIAQAARNGVLIKGGAHLENLGRIKAIAIDKTGTITHGKPEVGKIIDFRPQVNQIKLPENEETLPNREQPAIRNRENEILQLAASIENRSAHPLATPVIAAACERQIELLEMSEIESITGRGLSAKLNGVDVLAGNQKLMEDHNIPIPETAYQIITQLEAAGQTLLLIAYDGDLLGCIAMTDTLRTEAGHLMQDLSKLGITQTVMLTGDNRQAAGMVAHHAGLDDFRANLLPEDKQKVVRELVKQYGYVAMLGDGVNDAPALASATIGIAMGGAGTEVALETADVALMADDLSKLPFSIGLGRATTRIIAQNLAIALSTIVLLSTTSLAGLTSIGSAILIHEGSTILVVLNALRLLNYHWE